MNRLSRNFYTRDVLDVAPDLLGCNIIIGSSKEQKYLITEVEAYRDEEDLACHASKGRTNRTEVMYGIGGHVYVYLIYGMYWMLNVVTGSMDEPQAVLIRGIKQCNGPGRVGRLLNLDKSFYGIDLASSNRMWIEPSVYSFSNKINHSTRVGIDYAGAFWKNKKWRYMLSI